MYAPAAAALGRLSDGDRAPSLRAREAAVGVIGLGGAVAVGVASALGPLPGLLMLAGAVLALVVALRPGIGAIILVATVPVTSGFGRGVPISGLRISEALIAGIAAIVIVTADRTRIPSWGAIEWAGITYVTANALIGLGDIAARGDALTFSAIGGLLGPLQYFLLFRAVRIGLDSPARRVLALKTLLLMSIPVCLVAIIQQADVGGARLAIESLTGSALHEDPLYQDLPRATGTFPHWHILGGYCFVIILLAVAVLLEKRQRVLGRGCLVVVIGLCAVALVESAAIAPTIATVAGVMFLAWRAGHARKVVAGVLVGAVAAGFAFGNVVGARYEEQRSKPTIGQTAFLPETIRYRMDVWREQYLPALSGRLITGYGPELPPDVSWRYTESMYIELMLRGGIFLLGSFLLLMLMMYVLARRYEGEDDPERRIAARLVGIVVVALVFMHIIVPYFINGGLPHVLWILTAIMLPAAAERSRGPRANRRPRPGRSVRLATGH